MAVVQLDFFDNNDLNGDVIFSMTDEDTFFEKLVLDISLNSLGGAVLTTSRKIGHAMFRSGIYGPEVFVRVLIPRISETRYIWGFFIDLRSQQLIARVGARENFVIGGKGPLFYLTRGALLPEQFTGTGWNIDLANWVFRWNEDATAGRILVRIINEIHANPDVDFLPDLTRSFDAGDDSAGNAWVDDIAGSGTFELRIGQPLLDDVYDVQDASEYLDVTMNLGEVGAPLLELEAWQSYGRDLSGSAFGASVVLFKEKENIAGDLVASGRSLRRYTHVIVRGLDNAFVVVARPSWAGGDYAKVGEFDYGRSKSPAVLTRAGLRWLRRRENGENEFDLEMLPGATPGQGHYFPGPTGSDGDFWLGDETTIKTGTDALWSPIDYHYEEERVTGIRMELNNVTRAATARTQALSWHVFPRFNVERDSDNRLPERSKNTGQASCSCLKLCVAAVETPASCAADVSDLTQISTPNGGFETDGTTHWTHNELGGAHRVGPGTGDWEGDYYYDTGGAGWHLYTLPGSYSFIAGQPYIARIRAVETGGAAFVAFGDIGSGDFAQISAALSPGAPWVDFCVEWTPSATRTSGVVVQIGVDSGLDNFAFDDVRIYASGFSGGDDTEEFVGTSPRAARCDHKTHAADVLFEDGTNLEDVGGTPYTDEQAQDAVGGILQDSGSVDLAYNDGTPSITATVIPSGIDHGALGGLGDDDHPQYLLNPMTALGDMIVTTGALRNEATVGYGASATASTTYSTYVAGRAIDENDATEWGAVNEPAGEWLRVDLGAAKAIRAFRALQHPTSANNRALQYKLQSSIDDAAWTDRNVVGGPTVVDTGVLDLGTPITARYWRLLAVSDVVSGGWVINTFALYTTNGTPVLPRRLAIGTSGQRLTVSLAGEPEWATAAAAAVALDDLTDVIITSPAAADRLRYNGSAWVNSSLKWVPVTTFDGTNWVVAVDGSGNAIMTEV